MNRPKLVKEIKSRNKDFSQWYTDVCIKSELIEYSDIKGFFIYLPYSYEIWENIQNFLNKNLKKKNHQNVYFPLFFSENLFKKEKDHIEGFTPESLIINKVGEKKLKEKLILRPTSEVLFSRYYSKKVKSHRDLPKLFFQWCNVVRWEKTNKPFLRSKEFLWQEGHTIHSSKKEALKETKYVLNLYKKLGKKILAIPFISGKKTESEKFKGAEITFSLETLMYDGQSLQAATSHFLGTKFSNPFQIQFQDQKLKTRLVQQTSWGISTRLIGALIMIHGDDEGLVMPPFIAPIQIVIIPLDIKNKNILEISKNIYKKLKRKYKVCLDEQKKNIGWKFSYYELKGIPLRIEIGKKDIEKKEITIFIRHNFKKIVLSIEKIDQKIKELLLKINNEMFQKALNNLEKKIYEAKTYKEFKTILNQKKGYIKMNVYKDEAEKIIKMETGATARIIISEKVVDQICPITQKKANQTILFARAY
ncbi:MAG: prolyl-tRNA synthetase [Candidatus Phytoplasma cynodontis]|uniref:proline--tRNA ligase n=1 Tax='Cynodon dactylon' phytoplasma TaxID=295320 RepID=UPI001265C057|nr:proline--tRNA ligase ['Cynodon dactylon' phytoplasma]KAB8121953.1 proline--tRNA ligase ['Cynodon dactylon' phytoplasma]WIA07637.1 MAG: prolyl-tRNA synthetase [Candidatus Phytoplasma cynodontis]